MMSNSIIAILFLLISHSFAENSTTTNISHSPITPIQPTSIFSSTTTTKQQQQQQPQQGTTTTNGNVITAQYANTGTTSDLLATTAGVTPLLSSASTTTTTTSGSSSASSSTQSTISTDNMEPIVIDRDPEEGFRITGRPDMRESLGLQRALEWLKEKKSADYGWGNDTHMVILAKELSGGKDQPDADGHLQTISDLEDVLSVKQMEIEVMTLLDHHHTLPKPTNSERLAKYVLALGSLCKDPRRFHGHDLVTTLQHHEPTQDLEFALATLAACSSATHVRKRQIRRLLDIASGEMNNVDTIAMVLLALRCIITDHRHRHLQHFVRRPARGLASLQGPRGSFGSLRSTALAMQALQDLELDPSGKWNRSAASKWILDRQRSDGGWTEEPLQDGQDPSIGIGLTADIVLALGWKGLGAVRALQCDHVIRESNENPSENGEPKLAAPVGLITSAEEGEIRNVSYSYTLWVGTNVTESYSLSLVSSKNTSFFKAMTQAADQDSRFAFEAREWPNGHYVHTLAGKKEEPRGYNYWLLYRLPEMPDPLNPPGNQLIAPVGVDELLVEDGEHYLYWYKKL